MIGLFIPDDSYEVAACGECELHPDGSVPITWMVHDRGRRPNRVACPHRNVFTGDPI